MTDPLLDAGSIDEIGPIRPRPSLQKMLREN